MNLSELIENNDILVFNHFRINTNYFLSMFIFEKSMRDYSRNILIYIDDISALESIFSDDMTNLLLFDNDKLEEIKEYILIFPTIERFNNFINLNSDLINESKKNNIRLIILNNLINLSIDIGKKVLIKLNYFDKIIPIIYFENEDKNKKINQVTELYFDETHVIIDLNNEIDNQHSNCEIINNLYDVEELHCNNIHLFTIPDIVRLNDIRSKIMSKHTKIFFYVMYTNDEEVNENVKNYNSLISSFESRKGNMNYDILMCYKKDFLIFI